MKTLFACLFILLFTTAKAQTNNLDTLIDIGIEKYNNGDKIEALKIWQDIEHSAIADSPTYGTVLWNILYYYYQSTDENQMLEYYNKIINSKLNDKDRSYKGLGEIYKNYRYNATMILAGYYANQNKFATALQYINIADDKIIYEETSLTSVIYNKIKLTFWKKQLYTDLEKPDSAFYVLLKRAFEYDYKNMYKNWATVSESKSELNLSNAIIKNDTTRAGLIKFKSELDNSINQLSVKTINSADFISLNFRGLNYDIIVYKKLPSDAEYKDYLKKSFFYTFLSEKTKQ